MPRGANVGEFELLVLAALERLGDDAYAVPVRDEIEARTPRRVSLGAVYATLGRLGDKGLVEFWLSEPLPQRGGRARKHARITPAGRRALRDASQAIGSMLQGLRLGVRGLDGT